METKDGKKLHFLVVDDDGQVRHILTEYLRSFGFENIIQAKDGMSALRIVQNHQQPIDVVISDWEMPQVDGLVLLKAIRNDSFRENVKFVMVSSQSSRERMKISKAARSKVDAYVVKPFRAKVLFDKIQNILNNVVDSSVEEFEGMLDDIPQEVPSNQQRAVEKAKHKDKEKAEKLGKVYLDKESKGAGLLKSLKKLAQNGPKKVGKVTVKDEGQVDPGAVTQFMDQVFEGQEPEIPGSDIKSLPAHYNEDYDLNNMSSIQVLNLAKAYIQQQLYDKAIRLGMDAHFIFPKNADILVQLSIAYKLKGEREAALDQLKKAIKLDAYNVEAQTLMDEMTMEKKAG